ncbi:MAG: AmmeMemoRadiSam system protein B [Myxococcota bacterium]|jgi:AmmeMemoRadiSam system protein B|nr:AmmeMemoRadiSam system protein B [Myxococcota bacterium]
MSLGFRSKHEAGLALPLSMLFLLLLLGCQEPGRAAPASGRFESVREPVFAGTWYHGDGASLYRGIRAFIEAVPKRPIPSLRMLICPHAGIGLSGATAGHCYQQLDGLVFDRVWLLAPNHHQALTGIAVPSVEAFATPLGELPLDTERIAGLVVAGLARFDDDAHRPEHTIELQLPFLQASLLGGFRLIPLLVGDISPEQILHTGHTIGAQLGERDLVIISSDFTHFGSVFGHRPFDGPLPERIEQLDRAAFASLATLDTERWTEEVLATEVNPCGWRSIGIGLAMFESGQARLLEHVVSGTLDNNYEQCVSYLAIALSGTWYSASKHRD